jgi:hypothetical protein
VALDPLDQNASLTLSANYFDAGRLDDAVRVMEAVPPNLRSGDAGDYLVDLYVAQGRVADAERAIADVSDSAFRLVARSIVYTREGRRAPGDSALTALIAQYGSDAAYQIATIYAFRGNADSTFVWLDRAYDQRDQGLPEVKVDPFFNALHADPRFIAFLKKMRLPVT